MPLRIWASISLLRRILAALLLVVSIVSCVLALPTLVAHNAETPLVASSQAHGVGSTATNQGTVQRTAANNNGGSALVASPHRTGNTNGAILAHAPVQNYDSAVVVGCDVAVTGCLVIAVFAFIWLVRLPGVTALLPRRLPSFSGLIPRLVSLPRAPSLLVLSISRT